MNKMCNTCKEFKLLTDFAFRDKKKGTRLGMCKPCKNAYNKRDYEKKTEVYIAKAAVHNKAVRDAVAAQRNAYLAKCVCSDCGSKEGLQLFSKKGDMPLHELSKRTADSARVQAVIEQSIVRCLPCAGKILQRDEGHFLKRWRAQQAVEKRLKRQKHAMQMAAINQDPIDKMTLTTQAVANRLRPIFQKAVRDCTGVTYLLSSEEARVFSAADLEALEEETGYPPPDMPLIVCWTTPDSMRKSG